MAIRAVNTVIIVTRTTRAETIYIFSWCGHLIGGCWKYCHCHIGNTASGASFPFQQFLSFSSRRWLQPLSPQRMMIGYAAPCLAENVSKGKLKNGSVAQVCLTFHKQPMASPSFSSKSCSFVQSYSNCGLDEQTNQRTPNHDRGWNRYVAPYFAVGINTCKAF